MIFICIYLYFCTLLVHPEDHPWYVIETVFLQSEFYELLVASASITIFLGSLYLYKYIKLDFSLKANMATFIIPSLKIKPQIIISR